MTPTAIFFELQSDFDDGDSNIPRATARFWFGVMLTDGNILRATERF